MICNEYLNLDPLEQSIYTGKLIHAVQNDSKFFQFGKELIEMAELKGLFEKVKFHPDINHQDNEQHK